MDTNYITIKTASLNNHCPICYSTDGLELTFKQKFIETYFYKSFTSEIKQELNCTTCKSIVYPVQWTDDIDQVFEYHQKAFIPKKPSISLKKMSWIVIIGIVVALTTIIILITLS